MPKKLRVWVYVRVSTKKQWDWVWLDTQRSVVYEYLERKKDEYTYDENKHFYLDKASWALEYRPQLSLMLEAAKNNEIDVIIVYRADRLYRKIYLLAKAIEDLWEWWVGLVWVNDDINLVWKDWKAKMLLYWVFAEMERDLIRNRTMEAKRVKAELWYYVWWWKVKLWYDLRKDWFWKRLIVNNDEKRLVNKIFRLYTRDRYTLWEIRKQLEIDWEKTKDDRLKEKWKWSLKVVSWTWDTSVISRILKSEMYIWKYYYWRYKYKTEKDWKKTRKLSHKDDMVPLECPSILDEPDMFKEAQILLELNKKTRNNANSYPLVWLIKCWKCWKSYVWYRSTAAKWKKEYYRCKWSMRRSEFVERCCNFNISWTIIIDYIWKEIYNLFKDPEKFLKKMQKKEKKLDLANQFEEELELAKKNRKELIKLLTTYLEKVETCSEYQKEAYQNLINETTSKLEVEDKHINECEEKIEYNRWLYENIDNLEKIWKRYIENLDNFPMERKIELIQIFVEKIIINYESLSFTVYFRFKVDEDDFLNWGEDNWWENWWKGWSWPTWWENRGGWEVSNIPYPKKQRKKKADLKPKNKTDAVVSSTIYDNWPFEGL